MSKFYEQFKIVSQQVNNSIIFNRRFVGPAEILIQMVETLGIIIDRRPKEKPKKKVDK